MIICYLLACHCLEDIELFDLFDYIARLCLQVEEFFLVNRGDRHFLRDSNDLLKDGLAIQLVYVLKSLFNFLRLAHTFLNILDPLEYTLVCSFLLRKHIFVTQVFHLQSFYLRRHTCQFFDVLFQFEVFQRLFEHFFSIAFDLIH